MFSVDFVETLRAEFKALKHQLKQEWICFILHANNQCKVNKILKQVEGG